MWTSVFYVLHVLRTKLYAVALVMHECLVQRQQFKAVNAVLIPLMPATSVYLVESITLS